MPVVSIHKHRPKSHLLTLLCSTALTGAVLLSFASAKAQAQVVWQGDTDDNFNNGSNWSGGAVPSGAGMIAVFDSTGTTWTPHVSGTATLGGLEFAIGAPSYNLSVDADLGIYTSIVNNSGQVQTIDINSGSLQLANGASIGQLAINNSALFQFDGSSDASGATVVNNSIVALRGTFGAQTLSIGSLSGAGNLVFADTTGHRIELGALGLDDEISGAIISYDGVGDGGITKVGAGTLTLSGNSNYSGGTTISAGTILAASNNALGTGLVTLGGGTLALTGAHTLGNAIDLSAAGTIRFDAGANGTLTGDITTNGQMLTLNTLGTGTINGDIDGSTSAIEKAGSGTLTINGVISGTGAGIVAGSGTLVLNGANTYGGGSGSTVISDATLVVGNDQALSTSRLSVNSAGSVLSANKDVSLANNVSLLGGFGLTIDTAGHALDMSGVFQTIGGPAPIAKTGAGTLTLSGDNSGFTGDTTVSEGSLDITGGLGANVGTIDYTGAASDAAARVTGAGASWEITNQLRVGVLGTGTLTVENGGLVKSNEGIIGNTADADGTANISGLGSTWTMAGDLYVGHYGTGALETTGGGAVSSLRGVIGYFADSTGSAIVTGPNSSWTIGEILQVGRAGSGEILIADGGAVSSRYGTVGSETQDATGIATVTGTDSAWAVTETLEIGRFGNGELHIADGGTVTNTAGGIGVGSAAEGTVTVTGTGSTWTNSGALTIGDRGTGALTLAYGGTVSATDITIADQANGFGTLNIGAAAGDPAMAAGTLDTASVTFGEGTGAINFNHTGTGYEFAPEITGNGTVHQLAGITILTGANTYTGATHVDGGRLVVEGSLGNTATTVADSATLGGSGSISGDVTIADGGAIAPGSSAGTLTVGSLSLSSGSILDYELGQAGVVGSGVNDLIEVTGDLTLDGTLHITDIGGFGAGVYRLMNYGGNLIDNTLDFGTLPNGVTVTDLWVQTSVTNQVNLINTAGETLQFWDGDAVGNANNGAVDGGNGTWTIGNHTWTKADGALNGTISPGPGFAIFQGDAGTVTADAGAGALTATGMQFATDGYRIEGDAITLAGAGGESIIRVGDGSAAEANQTATIASELTGAGSLVKTGLGTLVLTGTNSFEGNTLVTAGTLVGDAASIRNDVANAGTVSFAQESDASFAGNIVGLNGVDGTMVKQGAGTMTLTGGSTLDWTIEEGGLITAAERFAGDTIVGDNGTITFDQAANAQYTGALTGAGGFIKTGAGALVYTGNGSAFTGTTTVDAGMLAVNGTLGGTLDIMAGSRLQGTGTVGTTTIASGGTIAPGNSIGTLTVDGDITFAAGSTYEVEINPALESDLIDASGAATINGGIVHALKAGGVYTPGSRWTIVGADGGVTGTFDDLTQNMPFVDLALAYDANNVYIDATRNAVAFCDVARTFNQCSTGDGLETTSAGNPVYDAVAALPDEDSARQALDALSGEIHASAKAALIEDSTHLRNAAGDRLRAAFDSVGAMSMPVMAYGPGGLEMVPAATDRFAAWVQAFGSWGSFDGDGNATGLDHDTGGLLMGVDGFVTETWRLGLIAGYSHSSFDAEDRASSGSSDNYHLGLYAGTQWDNLGLRTGLAYTWHDVKTSRTVSFPGFHDGLAGDYSAGTFQAFGELGYKIETAAVSFEPFANLAYVNLRTDAFTETGGTAALHSQGQTTDTTFTTLGIRAAADFDLDGIRANARGMLGWRHAFGDTAQLSTHAFAGSDAFTVAGTPIEEDAAIIEAGLDLNLTDTATFGIAYQGQIGRDARQHGFNAKLNVKF